ncbi:hypothetical protein CR513_36018, partial [Mucuna pruriens]
MVLRENGKVESESSQEDTSSSSGGEFSSEGSHYEGNLLMPRRLMSSIVGEEESQREIIFHSRCLVLRKLCSFIVDGRSNVNVASLRLVEKLVFPTLPYPRPYKLQWLSEKGELVVDRLVSLAITLGSFKDMLEEYKWMFPKDMPYGLPPLRGIEHHIDLIVGGSLLNRPAYRANSEVSKEIQKKVEKLLEKGWENLSQPDQLLPRPNRLLNLVAQEEHCGPTEADPAKARFFPTEPSSAATILSISLTFQLLALAPLVVHSTLVLRLSWSRRSRLGTGKPEVIRVYFLFTFYISTQTPYVLAFPSKAESNPTLLHPFVFKSALSRDSVGYGSAESVSDLSLSRASRMLHYHAFHHKQNTFTYILTTTKSIPSLNLTSLSIVSRNNQPKMSLELSEKGQGFQQKVLQMYIENCYLAITLSDSKSVYV